MLTGICYGFRLLAHPLNTVVNFEFRRRLMGLKSWQTDSSLKRRDYAGMLIIGFVTEEKMSHELRS